jgi:hypothetical protein
MDETEWPSSTDPQAMLAWMTTHTHEAGRAPRYSDRKLRLFACACVRQVWHLLTDGRSRTAVEVAERWADGQAVGEERYRAERAAWITPHQVPPESEAHAPWLAACYTCWPETHYLAERVLEVLDRGRERQAALLREVTGSPFRPVEFPCCHCTGGGCDCCEGRGYALEFPSRWLTPTVLSLAHAAYLERPGRACERCCGIGFIDRNPMGGPDPNPNIRYVMAPPRHWECPACHGAGRTENGAIDPLCLAELSDALEEAGCQEEALLRHLRGYERCRYCLMSPDVAAGLYAYCEPCRVIRAADPGWLPLRGPHVRGCWVLDLVVGKE